MPRGDPHARLVPPGRRWSSRSVSPSSTPSAPRIGLAERRARCPRPPWSAALGIPAARHCWRRCRRRRVGSGRSQQREAGLRREPGERRQAAAARGSTRRRRRPGKHTVVQRSCARRPRSAGLRPAPCPGLANAVVVVAHRSGRRGGQQAGQRPRVIERADQGLHEAGRAVGRRAGRPSFRADASRARASRSGPRFRRDRGRGGCRVLPCRAPRRCRVAGRVIGRVGARDQQRVHAAGFEVARPASASVAVARARRPGRGRSTGA